MKTLIVVDMQNDFITGALGSENAQAIVPVMRETIKKFYENGDMIFYTLDQHKDDYLSTLEGKILPVEHCIKGTKGYELEPSIWSALAGHSFPIIKHTFGYTEWSGEINPWTEAIYIAGLCTDICVISNALILRASFPNIPIYFIEDASSATSPQAQEASRILLRNNQIFITRSKEIV